MINWSYHIKIGRRSSVSVRDMGRKASLLKNLGVEVTTYDRLIEAARTVDVRDKSRGERPGP